MNSYIESLDLLIAPKSEFDPTEEQLLSLLRAAEIPTKAPIRIDAQQYWVFLFPHSEFSGNVVCNEKGRHLCLLEGTWPDPLGLRLRQVSSGWEIESDAFGLRPLYYGGRQTRPEVISTLPQLVAKVLKTGLSTRSIVDQLLLNYTLAEHTLFQDVNRLPMGKRIFVSGREGMVLETADVDWAKEPFLPRDAEESLLTAVSDRVVDAFSRGFAIDLTGGGLTVGWCSPWL